MTETRESQIMNWQKARKFPEEMLEEAALWHARIADDAAGEDVWLSLTEWLDAHEDHRHAFDYVEDMLDDMSPLSKPIQEAFSGTETAEDMPAAEVHPDTKVDAENENRGTVVDASWRWKKTGVLAAIAATAAAVMLVFMNVSLFQAPEVVTATYITGVGEQRLVQLKDGSSVHLNTSTKLDVTLHADSRQTRLDYGEAVFSVAKDRARPFFVSVGDKQVRVVGTKFNILRHAGTVTVTVAEGIVDVAQRSALDAPAQDPSRLTAGKQLVHVEGTVDSEIRDVNADTFLSWQSGILAYEEASLAYTLDELSRYFETPIKVEGDVSHIKFSGVLNMRDRDAVLELLAETLPIKITREEGAIIVTANK